MVGQAPDSLLKPFPLTSGGGPVALGLSSSCIITTSVTTSVCR